MSSILFAQTSDNTLTRSPYSLFGLGVQSNSNIGTNSALGKGGIALESKNMINNYNPASFASIPEQSFLLDIGFLGEFNTISNSNGDESRLAASFSNLAFAFSINDSSGLGVSIVPFTDVGYSLVGITSNIEGSQDEFISSITGSGGLSDIRINYGYRIFDNVRVGIRASYIFGSILETENITTVDSYLDIIEENYYNGLRLGVGFQFDINDSYSMGLTTDLPTSLHSSQDRLVEKTLDNVLITVENEEDLFVTNFKLPLEIGFGIRAKPINTITINADYKMNMWGQTEQSDNIGQFVNQSIVSLGAQYKANERGFKYWQHIEFRAGINYDTGYLKVNNKVIDNYGFSAGLGLPINRKGTSMLNISYTTGQRGSVSGLLLQENYNLINVNLSLKDTWFQRIFFK
ncbi:membrane protein [Aquimarina addita]|uniref:Membrane protein n=1 Tax=Aquimarina addita TaxID=870485 RepID=A0ABP7XDJ5_9FLAO